MKEIIVLIFIFSNCFLFSKNSFLIVFKDGESNEIVSNVIIETSNSKTQITTNNDVFFISNLTRNEKLKVNAENYLEKWISKSDIKKGLDTNFIILIPSEKLITQRWEKKMEFLKSYVQIDTIMVDSINDVSVIIKKRLKISEAIRYHCSESLCSYGRTFKNGIYLTFDQNGYLKVDRIINMKSNITCQILNNYLQQFIYELPLICIKELRGQKETSRFFFPFTIAF